MPPHHVAALAHLVGFLTGAALYGMLFGLVVRRRPPGDRRGTSDDDVLPILTAILGLIWNVTNLAAYAIQDFAGSNPHPALSATAYGALGFLPAVAVHSVLRSQSRYRRVAAAFIVLAYGVSAIAAALMFWSARSALVPSTGALQMLTWSYAALTLPILILTRGSLRTARAWSILALAVFAVSALHLSHREGARESWLIELIGHQASIPLIFAILYQDFRFALADIFLKRALALFALVAIASGLYSGVEVPLLTRHDFRSDPVAVGVSIILWVGMAIMYQPLRRAAEWLVDRVVLHRVQYDTLRDLISRSIASADDDEAVLEIITSALRGPLAASSVRALDSGGAEAAGETIIPIPTTEAPRYAFAVGQLAGGRQLLSDDLELLRSVALIGARRIDAIRLAGERYEQSLREQEMSKLATEAELRALRAQVNPHFLFNALNTIGYLIQTSNLRAHATLMKLTSLLRGVLRSGGTPGTLGEEIELVSAYLEIERARFDERLQIEIDIPQALRDLPLPPLLIQPLVENAIKHGIARSRAGGRVAIRASLESESLVITVRNTGSSTNDAEIRDGRRRGVGLQNLDARLRHLFGGAAELKITALEDGTRADIRLPVDGSYSPSAIARGA